MDLNILCKCDIIYLCFGINIIRKGRANHMATYGYTANKEYTEESRWYDKNEFTTVNGKRVHMSEWKLGEMKNGLLGNGWEEVKSFIREGSNGSRQAVLVRKKCC